MTLLRIAWRNLWRNKRRTVLTCGALAFATLLIQVGMSFQAGSYRPMIEVGTKFGSGHLQVTHDEYIDSHLIEHSVPEPSIVREQLQALLGIETIAFRSESFALINHGEKSFGVLVVGVESEHEPEVSLLPHRLVKGNYLLKPNDAFIGSALARNLDVSVNDELVILGSSQLGGVAATIVRVSGIFESGNVDLDRSTVQIHIDLFSETFEMDDKIHRAVMLVDNPLNMKEIERHIENKLSKNLQLHTWAQLMPEINESIALDRISNGIVYSVLIVIVVLSIANTFTMIMFERTREFGILRAVGMRNHSIFVMFSMESLLVWCVGTVVGLLLSLAVILPFSKYGISLSSATMEELAGQFFLPDRIYATLDTLVVVVAPSALGVGIFLATCFAGTRLYRVSILQALRFRE